MGKLQRLDIGASRAGLEHNASSIYAKHGLGREREKERPLKTERGIFSQNAAQRSTAQRVYLTEARKSSGSTGSGHCMNKESVESIEISLDKRARGKREMTSIAGARLYLVYYYE